MKQTYPEKLYDRLSIEAGLVDDCWSWGMSIGSHGYGQIGWGGKDGRGTVTAHRVVYEAIHGRLPDGFVVDHLCMNRWCVNPHHMEAVTHSENHKRAHVWCKTGQRKRCLVCDKTNEVVRKGRRG